MNVKHRKLIKSSLRTFLFSCCVAVGTTYAQDVNNNSSAGDNTDSDNLDEVITPTAAKGDQVPDLFADLGEEEVVEVAEDVTPVADITPDVEVAEEIIEVADADEIAEDVAVAEVTEEVEAIEDITPAVEVAEEIPAVEIEEPVAVEIAAEEVPAEDVAVEVAVEETGEVAVAVEEPAEPLDELTEKERVIKEAALVKANQAMAAAEAAEAAGELIQAKQEYTKTIRLLENIGQYGSIITNNIATAKQALFRVNSKLASINRALAAEKSDGKYYDDALVLLEEAKTLDPKQVDSINEQMAVIQEAKKRVDYISDIKAKNVDPEKSERDLDMKTLAEQGAVLLNNHRYEEAIVKFQEMQRINPTSEIAMRGIRRAQDKLQEAAKARVELDRQRAINDVTWSKVRSLPKKINNQALAGPSVTISKGSATEKIDNKLDSIVLAQFEVKNVKIQDVVTLLIDKARTADELKEGINIVYLDNNTGGAAQAIEETPVDDGFGGGDDGFGGGDDGFGDFGGGDDGFGDFGAEADPFADAGATTTTTAADTSGGDVLISLSLSNLTLRQVIDNVCKYAKMQWRVDPNVIYIAKELPPQDPETRMYAVRPSFIDMVSNAAPGEEDKADEEEDAGGWGGGWGTEETTTTSGSKSVSSKQLKDFFKTLGVSFPRGAEIQYISALGKLVVTHEPKILAKVQTLIQELDQGRSLVNIEAKFVEIGQDDMEELGFEWLLNDQVGLFGDRFQILANNSDQMNITSGLRDLSSLTTGVTENASRMLTAQLSMGKFEFETTLKALQQKGSSDVLSAPQVTTVSDEPATIKSVIRRYFPVNWTEPEPGDGGGGTIQIDGEETAVTNSTPSVPEFGEPTELGIILEVTPRVPANGSEIELALQPSVKAFEGYDEEIKIPFPGVGEYSPKMPIINERSINTNVVCEDGETVVLGGLISERLIGYEDKVPFLSDIPFFGKFFQSKGEHSKKVNLMVFVTAQLVDSAGRPIRYIGEDVKSSDNGIPLRNNF